MAIIIASLRQDDWKRDRYEWKCDCSMQCQRYHRQAKAMTGRNSKSNSTSVDHCSSVPRDISTEKEIIFSFGKRVSVWGQ